MSEELLEFPTYEQLKGQMEKNNWDVEIYRKKLENMFSYLYIIEINTLFKVILAHPCVLINVFYCEVLTTHQNNPLFTSFYVRVSTCWLWKFRKFFIRMISGITIARSMSTMLARHLEFMGRSYLQIKS